jgi:hypothetical protein
MSRRTIIPSASSQSPHPLIPAKAGIYRQGQRLTPAMDSRVRGNERRDGHPTIPFLARDGPPS